MTLSVRVFIAVISMIAFIIVGAESQKDTQGAAGYAQVNVPLLIMMLVEGISGLALLIMNYRGLL